MDHYMHEVPGRIRVKIPAVQRNPRAAAQLESVCTYLFGVESVTVNAVTGSLIVRYDKEKTHSKGILNRLKELGFVDESKLKSSQERFEAATGNAARAIGRFFFGFAMKRALENTGLSFLAALI